MILKHTSVHGFINFLKNLLIFASIQKVNKTMSTLHKNASVFRTSFFIMMGLAFVLILHKSHAGYSQVDSLQSALERTINQKEKARLYNKLSDKFLDKDILMAQKYADSAKTIGHQLSDYNIISNSYVNIANSYYFQGDLDSTLYFFGKSYYSICNTNNKNEIAAALNRLGFIYESKSNYSMAANFYYKALKIYESNQYNKGIAEVLNNIGIIHDALKQSEPALENYNKSLHYFELAKNIEGKANVYNNLATHYTERGNNDTAAYYFKNAIQIMLELNRTSEAATAYLNAAGLLYKMGNNKQADSYIDSALTFYNYTHNIHGIANVYSEQAKRLVQKNDFYNAIKLLNESLEMRIKVGNLNSQTQTLHQISSVYAQSGDFENALLFYKKHIELRDSIVDENTKSLISELNIKYETDKKDAEIIILKKESEIKKTHNYLLVIISTALIISVFLLFVFLRTKTRLLKTQKDYYEQQKDFNLLKFEQQEIEQKHLEKEIANHQKINEFQKKQFQQDLELSKRELLTTTMHVLSKNKTLSEIQDHLNGLIANDPSKNKTYKILLKMISDNISLDSDWEQFKIHFEKVNIDFFEKLQQEFPQLSQGDLKVCAYIKIKLSTKEIAQMMNISPAGINKRLYRIRKKMELEPHSNISDVLDGF